MVIVAHHFMRAPADYKIEHAIRWGQVHAFGGSEPLTRALIGELYGEDLNWIADDALAGFEAPPLPKPGNRGLSGQRGLHFPEPPKDDPGKIVGAP